jgi:hypothetical protein
VSLSRPDLYYGGDNFSVEQPQSFTCPYCGRMGYTETSLQEHVSSEHAETSTEVVRTLTRDCHTPTQYYVKSLFLFLPPSNEIYLNV